MIVYLLLTIVGAFFAGILFGYAAKRSDPPLIGVAILCTFLMGVALVKFLITLKDAGVL